MKRYVALLRGINVSGKNKLSMEELKTVFSVHGYSDIVSYINSGNIIFSCDEQDELLISNNIRLMINKEFGLDIAVLVIVQNELQGILSNAPDWWGCGDKEWYDNLIFVLPTSSAVEIVEKAGEPTVDVELINVCENCIYWSFERKKYTESNWWKKTSNANIGRMLTIRNANTVRKIAVM